MERKTLVEYYFYPQTGDINFKPLSILRSVGARSKHSRMLFGSLRKSESVFGTFWKIFGNDIAKNVERIVGILCNKNKITWSGGDPKFLFSCLKYFTSSLRSLA